MGQGQIYDLGSCQILFDGVDLGKSFGDVIFRSGVASQPIHEDQAGTTPVDEVITGREVTVEIPLTRASVETLAKVVPNSELSGDTLKVKNPVGTTLRDTAKELILKPIKDNEPSADPKTWLTVFKASPREDFEIVYNNEGQRVFKVTFVAFPDDTSGNVGYIWKMG